MKKMMLLAGLLVLGVVGYAAEGSSGFEAEDSFKAHVKVIQPLNVKADERLEFGTVVIGQEAVRTPDPLNLVITGEAGKAIKISYLMNGELMQNHNIIMKNDASENTITGYLVNENNTNIETEQYLELTNGKIERKIYGRITRVPDVISGDYYSDPVTIKVQYQ